MFDICFTALVEKQCLVGVHGHKNEEDSTTVASVDTRDDRSEQSYDFQDAAKSKTSCRCPMSRLMVFSFIVMIVGFTFATPFSLLLTIPAYVLADQVSTSDT